MELILWRHCEAEDGEPDAQRRLTARGRADAARMAAWLASRLGADARILAAPAVRTQQTAAALGRPFETVRDLAPGAGVDDVLRAAGWPSTPFVLVVGHEPTLGDVAGALLDGGARSRPLHKGQVVWLSNVGAGASTARLVAAMDPDAVAGARGRYGGA